MHKLPVLATAGRAYAFLLHETGTIIRLSWFPLLIVTIVDYFVQLTVFENMRTALESGVGRFEPPEPPILLQVTGLIIGALGTAIVAVALHRVILFGDRMPGRMIHLAFGKIELLFALLPVLGMVIVSVVAAIVFPVLAVAFGSSFLAAVVMLALLLAGIYLTTRLSLVLPLLVLTGRYQFAQAWRLTAGNFWQLLGVFLLVSLPLVAILVLVQWMYLPDSSQLSPGGERASLMAMLDSLSALLIPSAVLQFISSIAFGALGVAALSYSYKALTGHDFDDVLTPQG